VKRVTYVWRDKDKVAGRTFRHERKGLQVNDNTFMSKDGELLSFYQTVDSDPLPVKNGVIEGVKVKGIEIELNKKGQTLDIEELAGLTVAELAQYLQIQW